MTSQKESGRVYKLGQFKIKFRNPIKRNTLVSHCNKINSMIELKAANKEIAGRDEQELLVDPELNETCNPDSLTLWLRLNSKVSYFGFSIQDFKLVLLPRDSLSGEDDNKVNSLGIMSKIGLVLILITAIFLTIFACVGVKKEKKKKYQLKDDLKMVNRQLRAQVMDLKYRQENEMLNKQQDRKTQEFCEDGTLFGDGVDGEEEFATTLGDHKV